MAHYKILPQKLTKSSSAALEDTQLNFTKYLLAFASASNEGFNLVTAQIRFANNEPWRIVQSNMPSNRGELVIELGYFNPGSAIQVFWIVRAVTNIASISTYIINGTTREIKKIAPKTGIKKLVRGEDWGEEVLNTILF